MIKEKSVTVFAPASVANISCGFDIMGFALEGIGDRVKINIGENFDENTIHLTGRYADYVPSSRSMNSAGVAINAMLNSLGIVDLKIGITLEKNLPVGSGLGSSASGAAAAVYALNELLDKPLGIKELVQFAMEGERAACGTAHADNVAPSLLGGFVLIRCYDPLDVIQVNPPGDLFCVVIHPHIEVKTSDARRVLKKEFPLDVVTRQSANTAALMTGLLTGDYSLIGRSMNDLLAEPRRTMLIPGFSAAKKYALETGALGCGISGSGPSVFALCTNRNDARIIAQEMQRGFTEAGLISDIIISTMHAPGAKIV
ncbi:MAG: homoserine kinase [Bacteroidales bacterium]